jgi:Cytochrome c554 and c-prime
MNKQNPWLWVTLAASLAGIVIILYIYMYATSEPGGQQTAVPDPIDRFLNRHWANPLPAQGFPPSAFSAVEGSLGPDACAQCHAEQYREWNTSLHSQAIGPGLLWQLQVMGQKGANGCLRCHAPLAEQKALMALEYGWSAVPKTPPPAYVPAKLHRQGLVCAACHVRQHERFGPPPRTAPVSGDSQRRPHNGFTPDAAFQDSRFCATCHQHPDDWTRLNGKLRLNTYEEWRNSRFAKEGKSCQSCHMPDRQHLWRGIHDKDMVRQAITISLSVERQGNNKARAQAMIANTGAGHNFPTYLVPKVYATLHLLQQDGSEHTEIASKTIGWMADVELSKEVYDTRIPAGERLTFGADFRVPPGPGWQVELRMDVIPDEQYERFYKYNLRTQASKLDDKTVALIRQALVETEARHYLLSRTRRPVPPYADK